MKLRKMIIERIGKTILLFFGNAQTKEGVIAGREKLLAIKRMKRCSLIPKTKIKMETVEV